MAKRGARGSRQSRKLGLFLALLIVIAAVFVIKGQFVVKSVQVSGNLTRSAEVIAEMSGISAGMDIFKLNEQAVERQIESDPYLQVVSIERHYPSTVVINVRESEPCAAIDSMGLFLLIDRECRFLEYLNQIDLEGVITVTGIEIRALREGARVESEKWGQIDDLEKLLAAIGNQNVAGKISVLDLHDLDNLYLISKIGVQVELGDSELLNEKMVWFDVVLDQLAGSGVTSGILDVSSGRNGAYRAQ